MTPEKVLQGFVAFIGHGNNSRGRFPKTLTELSNDVREYLEGITPCDCEMCVWLRDNQGSGK